MELMLPELLAQVLGLFILAIPVACISWTVTHEELFRGMREYCQGRSSSHPSVVCRKFFYLFTCEYCFSHYVALLIAALSGFRMLTPDWRGYVISVFSLVWIANVYMSIHNRIRIDIRSERADAEIKETTRKSIVDAAPGKAGSD